VWGKHTGSYFSGGVYFAVRSEQISTARRFYGAATDTGVTGSLASLISLLLIFMLYAQGGAN
jgi:hypothetical protein